MPFPQLDFVKIFSQKLRISRGKQRSKHREERTWINSRSTKQLYFNAPWHSPAILFQLEGSNQLNLWANPNLAVPPSADSVHWELYSDLIAFLNAHNLAASFVDIELSHNYYSTEVYTYRWGMRILAVENMDDSYFQADDIRDEVRQQSDFSAMLYELAYRYRLSSICGPTRACRYFLGSLTSLNEANVKIIALPNYHETRQERYLQQIAACHKLTITEWLKFHSIAVKTHAANMPCNYEALIRQIRE